MPSCLKSTVSLLCGTILLAFSTVAAHKYYSNSASELSMRSDMQVDDGDVSSIQAGQTCPLSGACEVCHTAQIGSDGYFHVCPDDGNPCNQTLCYYSSVCRCNPRLLDTALWMCNSTTILLIEGITVNVTHYTMITPGQDVPDKTCIVTEPFIDSCNPDCKVICSLTDTVCLNNTKTKNFSSCDVDGCDCMPGYLPPDCCKCNATHYYQPRPGICEPLCLPRERCSIRPNIPGAAAGCAKCRWDFKPLDCCNCTDGLTEIDGRCKCENNTKPNGECKDEYQAYNCCTCAPGYAMNQDKECVPTFCEKSCVDFQRDTGECSNCTGGFELPNCCNCSDDKTNVNGICKCENNTKENGECKDGYAPDDCCTCASDYTDKNGTCVSNKCDKNQTLYFYIDATASNKFENFCPLMVVLQMLVAAFNPSATSGTKIGALLFSDNARDKPPSPVFDVGTSCFDGVQGSGRSLSSLMIDFGVCLDHGRTDYDSTLFPPLCGEGTSAVKGLDKIYDFASSAKGTTEKAVLMLTDGIIMDDTEERRKVLSKLNSTGISTIITAGINEADEENLRLYTSRDNILVGTDAVQLGIDIVNKMEERDIICKDHAGNITKKLNSTRGGNSVSLFCRCHRKGNINNELCQHPKYPTCGGDLSFGLPNLPKLKGQSLLSETQDVQGSVSLEEEILAAVEKMLEKFSG